jgi:hypothetical protein
MDMHAPEARDRHLELKNMKLNRFSLAWNTVIWRVCVGVSLDLLLVPSGASAFPRD